MKRKICWSLLLLSMTGLFYSFDTTGPGKGTAGIRWLDISGDTSRQVVVARGTDAIYQGHVTTVLLPGTQTIYGVWTIGHGGYCGPMKRSDNGGVTWTGLLNVPSNWQTVKNCPAVYRLPDARGHYRLFVFAGNGPDGSMYQSVSNDEGKTWSPMVSNHTGPNVMPFCTILPIEGGKRLLGMSNTRRPGETKEKRSNVVTRSYSSDGGFTWSPWEIVLDTNGFKPCEPELIRSPDGRELLCLLRENQQRRSWYMRSKDEGKTWSAPQVLPETLFGDRHQAKYSSDGRLVIVFRDTGKNSPTRNHFVAWIGTYEDILKGDPGQFRVKLLHSYKGGDCGYSGLERLPGDTFVATTYIKYRPGPEKNSVVSVRFRLHDIEEQAKRLKNGMLPE
ncbi:sialidase family protein [Niabella aurantiaca]|uniref:sialidase family protein n=1 Tax=Niabella aurantiaca TaxID=379900 RepID=UPI001B7F9E83|nr:sialidase family protein [Niabella aurantiaca]